MTFIGQTPGTQLRLGVLLASAVLLVSACRGSDPLLSFLDDESSLSFTHPPRFSVGFAEQNGIRYRYITAPKVESDKEALSITLIAPTAAAAPDAVAQPYLSGASGVTSVQAPEGASEWSFKDSSGVPSRLRVTPTTSGRYFGAWVRGSDAAMARHGKSIDTLLASLRVETAAKWPEERFASMVARAPSTWTRGSRLSSATHATMQFKSLPLAVEKGTDTVHGFITVAKEPVPPPGDLEALNKSVKDRGSDTMVLLEHKPWPALIGLNRPAGYADYLRSGTTLTSTRIRRWISVQGGVGLVFSCEARADAFDRLEPWCRRMAETVGFQ